MSAAGRMLERRHAGGGWARGVRPLLAALLLVVGAQRASAQTEVVEYYGQDALGSIRIVFNAQGAAIARADYEPFGELFTVPTMPGTSELPAKQFTGQERDAEASLDYFGARFFVPRTGRFSQVDPVYVGLLDPQQWNRYAYARNNPVSFVDPDGRQAAACEPGPFLYGWGFVWTCFDSVTVGGGGGSGIGGVPTQIVFPPWGGGGSIDTGGGNRQGVDLTPKPPTPTTPTTTTPTCGMPGQPACPSAPICGADGLPACPIVNVTDANAKSVITKAVSDAADVLDRSANCRSIFGGRGSADLFQRRFYYDPSVAAGGFVPSGNRSMIYFGGGFMLPTSRWSPSVFPGVSNPDLLRADVALHEFKHSVGLLGRDSGEGVTEFELAMSRLTNIQIAVYCQ